MQKGQIKSFLPDRGFGFIRPDAGGSNLFFHTRRSPGLVPEEGARVSYEIEDNPKNGKPQAVNLQPLGFSPGTNDW